MLKKFLVFASCLILIATTVGCGSKNKTATFAVGYGAEYFNNKTLDNTDIAKFAINAVSN